MATEGGCVPDGSAAAEVRWTVVVPVKAARLGKTRLAGDLGPDQRVELVRAMASDTVRAAAQARAVVRVVVVTGDEVVAAEAFATPGAGVDVVPEPFPGGLGAAVRAGVDRARGLDAGTGVAVLLGDLPALRPADLDAALTAAAAHPRAHVADAAGTGTTLLTVVPHVAPRARFGRGSAAAHAAAGHVALDVGPGSSLRQDVDVRADLDAVARLGAGPRTAEVLTAWGRLPAA
ncbi:2-phospho-L-lactate guanylyltransferase [Cellulomonas sp. NS3]|uniref:2-phospho-L-lactate guanylyltransferase n=1 Tax=Cellulomonas sp. NS3 TaxID=2973977 RepID=UPI002161AE9E|nr:2-phospho-L-lactate guanylyltransferase [Cellulomonas sp. NS3]